MSRDSRFAGDALDNYGQARLQRLPVPRGVSRRHVATWLTADERRDYLEREILRRRVLKNFGVDGSRRVSARLGRQIDQAIDLVLEKSDPDFLCRVYPMDNDNGTIRIGSDVTFRSGALAAGLGWCRHAAVYVASLGPAVDDAVEAAMGDRPDFGLVVDTVASEAAEFMVDEVEQAVSDRLPAREAISLPFSPGYCDWPVSEQAKLFALLPENPLGITLSATCLMSPRKSIAGLLGIGLAKDLDETCNPCKKCQTPCQHRRNRLRRARA